jgi:DNA-binding SARP family transcriptional activator
MEFRVLGSLEVVHGTREITPSAAKVRGVLAMLVLRHNQIVSTREFIDELWGERPPPSAHSTLQTYIYKLRKTLGADGREPLLTKPYGYLLQVDPATVDLHAFEREVAEGREALERGDAASASAVLTRALARWRGPALANLSPGELLSAHITRLEEGRLRALDLRLEADLRLGRHRELISELKELIVTHPLNEEFYAKLMTALHASGRRVEALEVFQHLRRMLVDQLGLEPSPELSRLQQRLLAADADRDPDRPAEPAIRLAPEPGDGEQTGDRTGDRSGDQAADQAVPPAQLPPDIADFVGREHAREWLANVLGRPARSATAVRVVCITGMPGVGKTALAVHAAHRARQNYPSGQLFARLTAPDGAPVDPGEVLAGFLRAAGVPARPTAW